MTNTRMAWTFAIALTILPAWPGVSAAQCLTQPKSIAAALTAKDAYPVGRAEATKWNADSALISMQSTSAGPMDAEGRSGHWMMQFYSKAARKLDIVNLTAGKLSCTAAAVEIAAPPVEVTAATILDTRRLLGIAEQAGGAALAARKPVVLTDLSDRSEPSAVWTITYVTSQGMPLLSVRIDSKSGAVIGKAPSADR